MADDAYQIRDISFFGSPRRVLMQSANGPCPLLAVCNVLLLRNQLVLPKAKPTICFSELIQMLSNLMLDLNARERDEVRAANIEQSMMSCIEILPTLNVGLDVNCRFSGPRDFEYTRELVVFDLLDISIVHGWLVSREDNEAFRIVGSLSYNVLAEQLVRCEEARQGAGGEASGDEADQAKLLKEGALMRNFLDSSASQLTYEGLVDLHGALKDRELAVLYRNHHFNTLLKHGDALHVLCTDIGFLEGSAVWERLDSVDGDTAYLGADFRAPGSPPPSLSLTAWPALASAPRGLVQTPAASASTGPVRASCPGCGSLNDFDIPGTRAAVRCGVCSHHFSVERPRAHHYAVRTCQGCGALNQFPAPSPGQPTPSVRCGACGQVS